MPQYLLNCIREKKLLKATNRKSVAFSNDLERQLVLVSKACHTTASGLSASYQWENICLMEHLEASVAPMASLCTLIAAAILSCQILGISCLFYCIQLLFHLTHALQQHQLREAKKINQLLDA